mgnify:CR=1 FL=1
MMQQFYTITTKRGRYLMLRTVDYSLMWGFGKQVKVLA